jgi:isoleucyl-tRNA synthetase
MEPAQMKDNTAMLNLPKTSFPMQADLKNKEPQILRRWQDMNLYRRLRENRRGAPQFILADGPPYANGKIHVGTAVNKVLKDIIIKWKSLQGFDAPYVPGWDCHGLPIEHCIEQQLGTAARAMERPAFRAACRAFAAQQVAVQRDDFIRLGVLGDWEHPYLTMDPAFEAEEVRALARLLERGHLSRGMKPVLWCSSCRSALAEAEVEYMDRRSTAIYAGFAAMQPERLGGIFGSAPQEGAPLWVIWTTTPWTLPANQALAIGQDFDYVLVACRQEGQPRQLIMAEALCAAVLEAIGATEPTILGRARGERLVGLQARHPFMDRTVPILAGEHVTLEMGTGIVHTAPAHGEEDFALGVRHGLEPCQLVLPDGRFAAELGRLSGLALDEAQPILLELLQEHQALLAAQPYPHSYPHCWRHKTPLFYRATWQWFIAMDRNHLREQALEAIGQVGWIPSWGKERIDGMVRHRPDWCISRQRLWGVPICLFTHRQSGVIHPRSVALMHAAADRIAVHGIDAWDALDPVELLGEEASCYDKSTDVLDVWFDSGLVHTCVLRQRPELRAPADMYLEGSDQHRGWFQSSLLTSVALYDAPPYRVVLTHGFVVDAQGHKMAKSRGNVIAPQEVCDTLGGDVLRWWVAATDYRGEMHISPEILKRMAEAYRRIRFTLRYCLSNLYDFGPEEHTIPPGQLLSFDSYVLARLSTTQQLIKEAYDSYQFHVATQHIHQFCVVELGHVALDVLKDRLYTMPASSHGRRSAQTMIHLITR